ncbi:lysophospholipase [Zeaxanthinibacter sp. PT1]|uniref:alpha/beta hydrolase n=1 Tax=Zeaxanthinibacter TaxID=561554 RepID=UPI00234AC521|nr:alpha/beta hydrolase [Zeaxanthinibacter sp. PT1]MDC6351392.1 lysophospholipase [Zeaxanthinibacter sp. PT1]
MLELHSFNSWKDDQKVFFDHEQPLDPKGVAVLIHGFGEHSGRYTQSVIPFLIAQGQAVLYYDNLGHGKTDGPRGYCQGYEELLDLLEYIITKATDLYPELPLFLYGHSMGGNLALNLVLRRSTPVSGVIATSPYLRLAYQPPGWKMKLGRILQRIAPRFAMPSGLDPEGISSIPDEVEKYREDPLVHDKITPNYAFPVMDAGDWTIKNADQLAIPTLVVHGKKDPIIDHRGSVEFADGTDYSKLVLLNEGLHELHHDVSREKLFQHIAKWFTDYYNDLEG